MLMDDPPSLEFSITEMARLCRMPRLKGVSLMSSASGAMLRPAIDSATARITGVRGFSSPRRSAARRKLRCCITSLSVDTWAWSGKNIRKFAVEEPQREQMLERRAELRAAQPWISSPRRTSSSGARV